MPDAGSAFFRAAACPTAEGFLAITPETTRLAACKADPGLLFGDNNQVEAFVTAIAKHRHYERETDPPAV